MAEQGAVGASLPVGQGEQPAEAASEADYTTSVVPMEKRRPIWKMAVLWATLEGAITGMVIGYAARSAGLTLVEQMAAGLLSVAVALVYGVGAANLGTYTGQTHTLLTRTIFGRVGSAFVSVLLIFQGMAFYCLSAFLLASILQAFIPISPVALWAAIFAFVMIFNNLFGFRGVAAYAVWLGLPLLIGWGIWTIIKGFATVPAHTLFSVPNVSPTTTVIIMASVLTGGLMWGNEPDFYRWSNPRKRWPNVVPLLSGYLFGSFIFPVTGYMMAELSNFTTEGAQVHYMMDFSLFGLAGFGIVIIVVNLVAGNDGNLYEAVNGLQNLIGGQRYWKRYMSVLLLGILGALVATQFGSLESAVFEVFGISGVLVPCATVVMVMDYFVAPRLLSGHRSAKNVTPWHLAGTANWIGIGALIGGLAVGTLMWGLIPGVPGYGVTTIGIPPLQAWATTAILYLIGLLLMRNSPRRGKLLGYPIQQSVELRTDQLVS